MSHHRYAVVAKMKPAGWTAARAALFLYLPALLFAPISFPAQASMTCKQVEQLPAISDPSFQEQLQAHVSVLPGSGTFQIKQLSSRFFIAAPNERSCPSPHCYYRLLELKSGVVKDVLAFRGTGKIWMMLSPVEVRVEFFRDDYSRLAFETPEKTYIGVALPRSGDNVLVEAVPTEQVKLLPEACRTSSR